MIFQQRYHGRMRTILPIVAVVVLSFGLLHRVLVEDSSPRKGEELVTFVQSIESTEKLYRIDFAELDKALQLNASQKGQIRLTLHKLQQHAIEPSNAVWQIVAVLDRPQQNRLADLLKLAP